MGVQIPLISSFLFFRHIYSDVGLLDHIYGKYKVFLTFWETSILFSIIVVLNYIPTISAQGFPFLHMLTSTNHLLSFWRWHSIRVSWCLIVALICVSLMISDAEHLSCACLPFICLLWKKMSIQFLLSDIISVRLYLIFASFMGHHFLPNNIMCYFLRMIPQFVTFFSFSGDSRYFREGKGW